MLAGVMAFGDVRKKYKQMPWRPYKKNHFLTLIFWTFLHFVEKLVRMNATIVSYQQKIFKKLHLKSRIVYQCVDAFSHLKGCIHFFKF